MKTYAARRLQKLQESVIRSITRYAAEKGAILLAQGFPDFDPPPEVLAAAEALDEVERRFSKLK
ncbi:MAG TPA: hypothetical protein VFE29_07765 [Terriglobia bacterium]|nr:hypothetical protein [Terriglobia bacterium]